MDRPRVALLSIGEEKGKGEARVQRATELIDETNLNFIGNVEGKDLTTADGRRGRLRRGARQRRDQVLRGPVGLHLRPAPGRVPAHRSGAGSRTCCCGRASAGSAGLFDYEAVGGSPLLGVRGAVIITHGRAKRRMIEHAVRVGATTARERVPERIAEALAADALAEAQAGHDAERAGLARSASDVDEALAAIETDPAVAGAADPVVAREGR